MDWSITVETDLFEHREVGPDGWGFWVSRGKDRFWVAISYVGDGPQEPRAEWIVSVNYDAGLNPVQRLLHKADAATLAELRDRVRHALEANSAMSVLPPG